MSDPALPYFEEERGRSPTVRKDSWLLRMRVILTVIIVVIFCVVAGFVAFREWNPPPPPPKQSLPEAIRALVNYPQPVVAPPTTADTKAPEPKKEEPKADNPKPDGFLQGLAPRVAPDQPQSKPHAVFSGPSFSMVTSQQQAATAGVDEGRGGNGGGGSQGPSGGGSGARSKRSGDMIYASSRGDGIMAGRLGDQTYVLPRGLLPCLFDWRVDSTLGGEIQCHIPFDIIRNGITLLDAGTTVHGSYSGDVKNGQARLQMAVDEIDNEKGHCFIKLEKAEVADSMGTAGGQGSLDNHYLERFGPAVLLSFTQQAMSLAQAALSKGGSTYISFNTGGGGGVDQLINEMFREGASIKPTITLNEGTPLSVVLNKRINFSGCYGLALRR